MVRALASRKCALGPISRPRVICELSFVVGSLVALRGFSLGTPGNPFQFGIRGPQVCQSQDC